MKSRDGAERSSSFCPDLGIGLGLRSTHYAHILDNRPRTEWFEAISENYMGLDDGFGGRPLKILEEIRSRYPVVLHGVSLSIGSADPLNQDYLNRLKRLIDRIEPAWVSDHLCWTGVEGENLHDLMPLPFTSDTLNHLVERIARVQDFLGRRILIENVSSYLTFAHSEITEWEFLSQVAKSADCGLLLDVNNIYVSSVNHDFDPQTYLDGIPMDRVGQMHLAGHTKKDGYLLDTHDHPVTGAVWNLYRSALARFGPVSTLIEWDDKIPAYSVLEKEAARARKLREETLGIRQAHAP